MKKVNWAVLGTARIAKKEVIPGILLSESSNLYAIAGRKSEKVTEFAQLFGFEKTYLCYDEMLTDPKVHAVYIPLSNDLHKEWVIKALRAKKHVLCEKPLVGTAKEVQEIIAVSQAEGVLFMEAFAYLHSPIVNDLVRRLNEGVIGKVKALETAFHIPRQSPAPPGLGECFRKGPVLHLLSSQLLAEHAWPCGWRLWYRNCCR